MMGRLTFMTTTDLRWSRCRGRQTGPRRWRLKISRGGGHLPSLCEGSLPHTPCLLIYRGGGRSRSRSRSSYCFRSRSSQFYRGYQCIPCLIKGRPVSIDLGDHSRAQSLHIDIDKGSHAHQENRWHEEVVICDENTNTCDKDLDPVGITFNRVIKKRNEFVYAHLKYVWLYCYNTAK